MKNILILITLLFLQLAFAENPPKGAQYPGNRDGDATDCCSANSLGGTEQGNPRVSPQYNNCLVTNTCGQGIVVPTPTTGIDGEKKD